MGTLIATERKRQRRTQKDLAERVGISTLTLAQVERGATGTEVGTVFEVATLLGIPLFPYLDDTVVEQTLSLLPARVYPSERLGDDDF